MQSVSYMGDGSTTEFSFNFPYYENTNIIVTKNGDTATGYTIIGTSAGLDADIPYTGGKVVFDTAPSILDSIKISRSLPLTRVVDYQPTAKLEPTSLNQDMNYMMEVLKDFSDKLDDFSAQYSEIVDKESTQNLIEKITNITEKIDEFDDEIEQGRIMSKDDFYTYTTNCITDIPQNVKLELNDGTLTLKTGSKIYVPNGAGVFNEISLTSDKSITSTTNGISLVLATSSGGSLTTLPITRCASGSTDSLTGTPYHVWYDTTNNTINYYGSDGTTFSGNRALPVGVITVTSGAISSINQVFNGFGYIGSTVFALPGISVLISNGQKTDGKSENYKYYVTSVNTTTVSESGWVALAKNQTDMIFSTTSWSLSDDNYLCWDGTKRTNADRFPIAYVKYENGQISAANFRNVMKAADKNDTTFIEIS